MMKHTLLIVLVLWCTNECTSSINNTLLRRVNRLGNSSYTDYYFCCNVVSQLLLWEYNDITIRGFLPSDIGAAAVSSRSGVQFTTTLLSARTLESDTSLAELDSILVVSFEDVNHLPFEVTCSNEVERHTIDSTTLTNEVINSNKIEDIVLDHVLSDAIVQSRSNTYVFVCGSNSDFQFLEIAGPVIGFSQTDRVGQERTVLSSDRSTVNVQGILMAQDPFNKITLLLVPKDSMVNVRCFYDNEHQVELSSQHQMELPSLPTAMDSSELSTSYISDSRPSESSNNSAAIFIVIGIVVTLILLMVVSMLIVLWLRFSRRLQTKKMAAYYAPAVDSNGSAVDIVSVEIPQTKLTRDYGFMKNKGAIISLDWQKQKKFENLNESMCQKELESKNESVEEPVQEKLENEIGAVGEHGKQELENGNETVEESVQQDMENWNETEGKSEQPNLENGNKTVGESVQPNLDNGNVAVGLENGNETVGGSVQLNLESGNETVMESVQQELENGNETVEESVQQDKENGNETVGKSEQPNLENGNETVGESVQPNLDNGNVAVGESLQLNLDNGNIAVGESLQLNLESGNETVEGSVQLNLENGNETVMESVQPDLEKNEMVGELEEDVEELVKENGNETKEEPVQENLCDGKEMPDYQEPVQEEHGKVDETDIYRMSKRAVICQGAFFGVPNSIQPIISWDTEVIGHSEEATQDEIQIQNPHQVVEDVFQYAKIISLKSSTNLYVGTDGNIYIIFSKRSSNFKVFNGMNKLCLDNFNWSTSFVYSGMEAGLNPYCSKQLQVHWKSDVMRCFKIFRVNAGLNLTRTVVPFNKNLSQKFLSHESKYNRVITDDDSWQAYKFSHLLPSLFANVQLFAVLPPHVLLISLFCLAVLFQSPNLLILAVLWIYRRFDFVSVS